MASPEILDFERLLAPIPGENACGADLRWEPVYQQIKEVRRQDDRDMLQAAESLVPNWAAVVELASECLATQSKDLMLTGWLTEAITRIYGFAGLRDGLRLISQLLENYWDGLYPLAEDGDLEPRVAPLVWLTDRDRGARLPNSLRDVALTPDQDECYSWNFWKSRYPQPKGETEEETVFEQRRVAADERAKRFDKAVSKMSREFTENLYQDMQQSAGELSRLEKILDDRFGSLAPGTGALREVLGETEVLVRRILKEKGGLADGDPAAQGSIHQDGHARSVFSGPIRSREEAFGRLAEVAAFLRQTEPQSPVSYLVERAATWGRMPFDQLLSELIKDSGVRGQVGELLGIKAPPPEES